MVNGRLNDRVDRILLYRVTGGIAQYGDQRTPSRRMATQTAYQHFGLRPPQGRLTQQDLQPTGDLFDALPD